MPITRRGKEDLEKVVENIPLGRRGQGAPKEARLKRAKPYIRGHLIMGRIYYYYCRGADKEIYLGSADAILKAVKRGRE